MRTLHSFLDCQKVRDVDSARAVKEITKLLPLICPLSQLPPACQQAIDARNRGDWLAALMLVEQECGSPSWDGAYAQAKAVEGTIWHAQGELKRALTCYQLARDDFGLRRKVEGEAVMDIALGMVHERNEELSKAQFAYQKAAIHFQKICGQPIDHDSEKLSHWCREVARILDARLESVRPNTGAQHELMPRWIPRLETAAAGPPQRYALQEWEPIDYVTTKHIRIGGITYELQPVARKTRPRIKLDPTVDYFITQAQGESMIGADIHDGDLLLVQVQQKPRTGQIAVVVEESEGGSAAQVKRIRYDGQRIHLESENPAFQTRTFTRDSPELRILGIVLAVLKENPADDNEISTFTYIEGFFPT